VLTCCLNELGKVNANLKARENELKNYDRILVPLVLNRHVTTLLIDKTTHRIIHYDPQGFNITQAGNKERQLKTELLALKNLFGEEYQVGVLTENKKVPHDQKSRVDCGPISMNFMQFLFDIENDVLNYTPSFQTSSAKRVEMRRGLESNPTFLESTSLDRDADEDALELPDNFEYDLEAKKD
jgi:hypothetical protein